jgi:sugar phosphate isomerase/epimerase
MNAHAPLSRRGFLRVTGAAAAAAGLSARAAEDEKKIPIGLQLYSVRGDCKKDFEGTVEAVAEIGYRGVEFAGYYQYGDKPKALRKLLDDNGLVCCGTHTHIGTLLGDRLKQTVEFHKILGNRYLIVPSLPGKYRRNVQAWRDTAKLFSDIAEKVKPHGMRVGYHNHAVEFKPLDGERPWDILFSTADPAVCMQLDTANCMAGGGDPVAALKKYADRAATVHLKESARDPKKAILGQGDVPLKEVFAICERTGKTDWYVVEQGRSPYPPLEAVRRCFENLKKMGKV